MDHAIINISYQEINIVIVGRLTIRVKVWKDQQCVLFWLHFEVQTRKDGTAVPFLSVIQVLDIDKKKRHI